MVSPLWKACADGDVAAVEALLKDATSVDIEIKDHTGVTPLIQAVKASNVDVVKALLAHGANPINASAQGRPETYTQDPHILQILAAARGDPIVPYPEPTQYYPYPQYPQYTPYPDPNVQYYPPAPPPQHQSPQDGDHAGTLPPPEVARNIPCRYFPACRYGSYCIFAHPQAPYFPGPLPPPAHYGPPPPNPPAPPPQSFDPNMPPPAPYPYYHPVSPQFNPVSPGHMRTHSEVLSPPPFSPSHPSLPMQYLSGPPPPPGPPISPLSAYPAPPPQTYPRRASITSAASYPSPAALDPAHGPVVPKLPDTQPNARPRRGSAAVRDGRPQYAGRKPPCLFFPTGRCRNGDDCRYPHVMPEGGASPPPPHGRGHFPPRSRAGTGYYNSRDSGAGAGYGTIEEKLSGLSIRDLPTPKDENPKSSGMPHANGKRATAPVKPQQRVPNADDFPVLRGTTPPQQQGNGHANGHAWAQAVNGTGPTAAQLLREKDTGASRGPSPRPPPAVKDSKSMTAPAPAANGSAPENLASTGKPAEVQVSA